MLLIKILLVLLLCVPLLYFAIRFSSKLVSEIQDQEKFTERIPRKRPYDRQKLGYDFRYMGEVDSKRNRTTAAQGKASGSARKKRGHDRRKKERPTDEFFRNDRK